MGRLGAVGAHELVGGPRDAEQVDEHVVGDEHVTGVVLEQHRRPEVVDERAHLGRRVGQPSLALAVLGHVVGPEQQAGHLGDVGEVLPDHLAQQVRAVGAAQPQVDAVARSSRPRGDLVHQAARGIRVVGVDDRQEAARQGRAGGQPEQPLAREERAVGVVRGADDHGLGGVPHDRLVARLRAAQQLLGAPQLGDVADEARELAPSLVAHRHRDELDDQGRAVAADRRQLEPLVEDRPLAGGGEPRDAGPVGRCVLRGDEQLAELAPHRLLAGPPEQQLGGGVELDDPPGLVDRDDGVEGGRDDGSATVRGRVLVRCRLGHGPSGRQRADGRVVAHAPTVDTVRGAGRSVRQRWPERF